MPRTKSLTLAVALLGLAFSQAAAAEWLHYANGVAQANSAKQKHTRTLTLWTVVPTEITNPTVCAAYESNHPKGNTGNIAGTARIDRADGSIETVEFDGQVNSNSYLDCQSATVPIATGDLVTFNLDFDKFPRQKMKNGRSDFFSVNGVVSNFGVPGGRAIPPGVNPPVTGGEVHASISMFAAERHRQRHPRRLTQSVVVPKAAQSPVICAALGNIAIPAKANNGRIITAVTVMHQDGSVTNMDFDGTVVDNIYRECQMGPSLAAGDEVIFNHRFRGLPKLRFGSGFFDPVATYGIVSPDGVPMLRSDR